MKLESLARPTLRPDGALAEALEELALWSFSKFEGKLIHVRTLRGYRFNGHYEELFFDHPVTVQVQDCELAWHCDWLDPYWDVTAHDPRIPRGAWWVLGPSYSVQGEMEYDAGEIKRVTI